MQRRLQPCADSAAGHRRRGPRNCCQHDRLECRACAAAASTDGPGELCHPALATRADAVRRPNFFIVGAPKCGTTSLATWLGRHPSVFIPHVKEPHHFNTDDAPLFASRSSYERLFRAASDQHLAIGEASASYLYSNDAVPNIEAAYPGSRFIVLLRNPVEMAPAWHAQILLSGVGETERDFATAWALQEARRQGRNVPSVTLNPRW